MNTHNRCKMLWRGGGSLLAAAVLTVAACDTEILNPGPVEDQFLDSLLAHEGVVRGAQRDLSDAFDQVAYWGAALTYEFNPAGSTGNRGIPTDIQAGFVKLNHEGDWERTQRARFTAEDALRRIQDALAAIEGAPAFDSYEPAAWAALTAGYANRLLGENFCEVTFDGGAVQPHTDALSRAEGYFDLAISMGGAAGEADIVTAAYAGRASVRAYLATYGLANWTDAAADAAMVTDNTFTYQAVYTAQDDDQYNFIQWAIADKPYRVHTQWATFYEEYYTNTGDARVPWVVPECPSCPDPDNPVGDAAVTKFGGNVPWFPQQKYTDRADNMNLSSGWEMRLIEAEAALNGGGGAAVAVPLMNVRRTDLGLPLIPVGTDAEAYTALKLERQLELWLEARRMGDIRRWEVNNISGGISDVTDAIYMDLDGDGDKEVDPVLTTIGTNHRGWPIGESERETNPNVTVQNTCPGISYIRKARRPRRSTTQRPVGLTGRRVAVSSCARHGAWCESTVWLDVVSNR